MTHDAIVVGGGIVGCACAFYLSKGFKKVALVEPGPIGGRATAAGMGHIVVMDDSEAQFALTQRSQQLWDEFAAELPDSAEFEKRGTLWIAADEAELEAARQKSDFYRQRGVRAEFLDGQALQEAEPNLGSFFAGAMRAPGDSIVFPMPVASWLLDRAAERGCDLVRSRAVFSDSGVELESGDRLEAGLVVNAAGDQAGTLTPGLPIEPRKGHLAITDRYPGYVHHQLVELGYLKSAHDLSSDSVAFNVQPRATGQLLIGSSRQFVGWDSGLDRAMLSKMLSRALKLMPSLGRLKVIRTWTGFRAATPDKLPLIGPWEDGKRVWIAAGHEGLGITTSLATGELLADLVLGRIPKLDAAAFDPNRVMHAH